MSDNSSVSIYRSQRANPSSLESSSLLSPAQLAAIMNALQQVGSYGEVHLVISDGRLRFIRIVRSLALPKGSDEF